MTETIPKIGTTVKTKGIPGPYMLVVAYKSVHSPDVTCFWFSTTHESQVQDFPVNMLASVPWQNHS